MDSSGGATWKRSISTLPNLYFCLGVVKNQSQRLQGTEEKGKEKMCQPTHISVHSDFCSRNLKRILLKSGFYSCGQLFASPWSYKAQNQIYRYMYVIDVSIYIFFFMTKQLYLSCIINIPWDSAPQHPLSIWDGE